ncbi:hypothetical protein PIB30_114984, partial [Stylosanthes scabra]|nr:hypothetical protein [Stylosanthes scabra]
QPYRAPPPLPSSPSSPRCLGTPPGTEAASSARRCSTHRRLRQRFRSAPGARPSPCRLRSSPASRAAASRYVEVPQRPAPAKPRQRRRGRARRRSARWRPAPAPARPSAGGGTRRRTAVS